MRGGVLKIGRLRLVRNAAIVALAALGAGCSADVSRFDDSFYTGSVPRQPTPRGVVGAGGAQAYPGSLDGTRTGSVNSGYEQPTYAAAARTAPVERSMLAPPSDAPAQTSVAAVPPPAYEPPPPAVEPAYQPPVRQAAAPVAAPAKAGWNRTGNVVTLRPSETVDTLANRYGVPAKAILAANGMKSAGEAEAGRQIEIPSYSYGGGRAAAPVAQADAGGRTLGAPPQPLRVPDGRQTAAAAVPVDVAPAARKPAAGGAVTVAAGDTLTNIARRNGTTVAALRAANGMTDDTVRLGQRLVLPGGVAEPRRVASLDKTSTASVAKPAVDPAAARQPKPYQPPQPAKAPEAKAAEPKPHAAEVKHAEPKPQPVVAAVEEPKAAPAAEAAPAAAAAAPKTTVDDAAERDVAAAAPASTGIEQFRWPVQGRVVKRFGDKDGARRNDGLDISVPRGTPVKAAENGVVIYAGDGLKEFGNTVLIKHDNGLVTVYGHADDLKVKRGETVRRGQEIATAGMSGDTDTPKVHFEVRKNSAPVDPSKFLQ